VARRSLKPQLNQIRSWVREGRTNAWIAHQLEVSVKDIDAFKREHGLAPDGANGGSEPAPDPDEMDLRAEDDALVAAALDAEPEEAEEPSDEAPKPRRGRRGRRGGRGRGSRDARPLEGTFDHGEEGYGLWLDPAVQDDAVYAEHWAGHRPVTVSVEPDQIVIRRSGEDGDGQGPELDEDEPDA
jgi:hypothetical protein